MAPDAEPSAAVDARQHFLCALQLNRRQRWVIWYSAEKDGLLLDAEGALASFRSADEAHAWAAQQAISIEPQDPPYYDFDRLRAWCRQPRAQSINCKKFLDAWNLLGDVFASTGGSSAFAGADSRMDGTYHRLFWGCNLPAVTPAGERFVPDWQTREVKALARLFTIGIRELGALVQTGI